MWTTGTTRVVCALNITVFTDRQGDSMNKDMFLKIISPMFDSSAHYGGSGSRTFTVSETSDFFDKMYVLFDENTKKVDVTKLTFALIKTQRKFSNYQEQAEHIASIL